MVERTMVSSFNHSYVRRAKASEPALRCGALIEAPVADPVAVLEATGAESLNPGLGFLTEAMVRAVRDAGRDVYVWTVNEVEDMRRILGWGVTGIFSDFPDRLIALLRA
jgi:glycerophosphoryl diester phosphodiesterase